MRHWLELGQSLLLLSLQIALINPTAGTANKHIYGKKHGAEKGGTRGEADTAIVGEFLVIKLQGEGEWARELGIKIKSILGIA